MNYMEQYNFWMTDSCFDEATKAELARIRGDEKEIEDRFHCNLKFGTGGLRGILGAGTNRMNVYTVRKATQGLANYILKQKGAERGVAIAYDSRRCSKEFAEETALCMAANGIRAYVFDSLRPTPELSFAVRKLQCISGVVITASHNPPEYNGYKVYWEDGAQITAPKDREIITEVLAITDFTQIKTMEKALAQEQGLYVQIGAELDDAYIAELKKQIIHPEVIQEASKKLKIVYTPLNGTGNVPVCRVLKELGFEQVYVVKEQQEPDPDFSTLKYPNPESAEAFTLALKLAKQVDADIIMATDPDADRLGIYVKDIRTEEYVLFSGNMFGVLLAEYILRERSLMGTMPEKPAFVSTIVSTDMAKRVAEAYGVHFIEVLTGFKYIGEQITLFERQNSYQYVFGMEESYGCLVGTHARDKDAVAAVMSLCEVAAWCSTKQISLWDMMLAMYEKYGYYREKQHTITFKGIDAARQTAAIIDRLRSKVPECMGDKAVTAVRDYQSGKIVYADGKPDGSTGLPASNVLYLELEQDAWCCVRPSGTEPKIKFYMGVKGSSLEDAEKQLEALTEAIKALAD